jgi:hypothetical protein
MDLIQRPGIQLYNKIRLGIIYALRYQKSFNQIGTVVEALIKAGASESDASVCPLAMLWLISTHKCASWFTFCSILRVRTSVRMTCSKTEIYSLAERAH